MSTYFDEGQHAGEFIVQQVDADRGDISVESGTYHTSSFSDGDVLALVGGKLQLATGGIDTAGDSDEVIIGIAIGKHDASSGDVTGAYLARLAVVDTNKINIAANKTAVVAALAKLFIIAR